jgi:antitoxin ChpS
MLYLYITIKRRNIMHITNLRKVGGSIMLAVPPAVLEVLHLHAGSKVGVAVSHGKLVIEPTSKPKYTLSELLAQCDKSARISKEDKAWLGDKPVGKELI